MTNSTRTPWEEEALIRFPRCEGASLEVSASLNRQAFCQGAQFGIAWAAEHFNLMKGLEVKEEGSE